MAICAHLNANNRVIANPSQDPANCPNYVLLNGSEYTDLPTLTDIFNVPIATDLQQMFMTGFSLPLIAYLTAWGFAVLINWFK